MQGPAGTHDNEHACTSGLEGNSCCRDDFQRGMFRHSRGMITANLPPISSESSVAPAALHSGMCCSPPCCVSVFCPTYVYRDLCCMRWDCVPRERSAHVPPTHTPGVSPSRHPGVCKGLVGLSIMTCCPAGHPRTHAKVHGFICGGVCHLARGLIAGVRRATSQVGAQYIMVACGACGGHCDWGG